MIVLTRTNGDEVLIPDRELNGLFTELRDLLQRQTEQARTEERQRCAGIVGSVLICIAHCVYVLDLQFRLYFAMLFPVEPLRATYQHLTI